MYDISERYAVVLPHLVFKFRFGLVYDKCYPCTRKPHFFVLVLVIANP